MQILQGYCEGPSGSPISTSSSRTAESLPPSDASPRAGPCETPSSTSSLMELIDRWSSESDDWSISRFLTMCAACLITWKGHSHLSHQRNNGWLHFLGFSSEQKKVTKLIVCHSEWSCTIHSEPGKFPSGSRFRWPCRWPESEPEELELWIRSRRTLLHSLTFKLNWWC